MFGRVGALGHVAMTHDRWRDLGYDWAQIGDPAVEAQPPFKVYLPRTTADVVCAVEESRRLGHPIVTRGAGHSSNNLVLAPDGALLLTAGLDRVLEIDREADTVTVQPGASVVDVDEALARHGLGLEVVPDHSDITVGGFVSVGGLSAASVRAGMFIDAVLGLEYVDSDGRLQQHSVVDDPAGLRSMLAAQGRTGVITQVRLRAVPADKERAVFRNRRQRFRDLTRFVAAACDTFKRTGGDAPHFARASWLDLAGPGRGLAMGTVSAYHPSSRGRLRARVAYGTLRSIGRLSTSLPAGAGGAAKKVGSAGLMLAPSYATHRDLERFSDGVIDWTVGDPSRLLVALAPVESAEAVVSGMYEAARELRARTGGLTYVTIHLKGIRSRFLTGPDGEERTYVEVLLVVGIDPSRLAPSDMSSFASSIDAVCLEHSAFRYQHTLVSTRDAEELRRLDPASRYAVAHA
jgi:UDP-N-acetylenolpyruvoylglucosamine reductase